MNARFDNIERCLGAGPGKRERASDNALIEEGLSHGVEACTADLEVRSYAGIRGGGCVM